MHSLQRLATTLVVALVVCPQLLSAAERRNSAAVANGVAPSSADVRVTKTASSLLVERGDPLAWTITVSNAGPDAADNVVLTDILPPQLTFNSIVAPATYSCVTPAPGTNGTVTCSRLSPMPNGTSEVFTLNTTVSPTAAPGAFPNTATATSTTPDPVANNIGNGISAVFPPIADARITKTAGPGPYIAGNNISFIITVTNAGPASAHNVVVTDTIPPGSTFVSATPTQGTCTGATCNLGTIAASGTASITIVVTAPAAPGPVTNTASVTVSDTDPDPTNNAATATVTTVPGTPATPAPVPTLSSWMLVLFAGALGVIVVTMRT